MAGAHGSVVKINIRFSSNHQDFVDLPRRFNPTGRSGRFRSDLRRISSESDRWESDEHRIGSDRNFSDPTPMNLLGLSYCKFQCNIQSIKKGGSLFVPTFFYGHRSDKFVTNTSSFEKVRMFGMKSAEDRN
jgi:hypothetical protein